MNTKLLFASAAVAVAGACSADLKDGAAPSPVVEAGAPDAGAVVDAGADAAVSLCPGGKAVDWPPSPYAVALTQTLPPDLEFKGAAGTVKLRDYFEPCAAQSRLLVIRTVAAWCGTCDWHARNTKSLFDDPRFAGRLELLDLLVADEDNMPPDPSVLARWTAKVDFEGAAAAIDADYTFKTALLTRGPLPAYVFVDTKTMQVRTTSSDPDPETFGNRVIVELASLDGTARPELVVPKLYDETFTQNQWDIIQGMKLANPVPPPDPTNEYGDVAAAATLGRELFSDVELGAVGSVSCATCHDPAKTFTDGMQTSEGVGHVDRNAPALALAAQARWQFWDGRADSLWAQALGPFENAIEIGSSRLYIAHQISDRYSAEYDAIFGDKYPLPDVSALPDLGKPGDAAYDALSADDKERVTRIYVNVGKAIAAFERSLRVEPNALDGYAGGDTTALTAIEKNALLQFMVSGCPQCHWGPRLTDDAFHVIRFPTGRHDAQPDRGRIDVLTTMGAAEFIGTSHWSDAPAAGRSLAYSGATPPSMLGAFKTPALRGVATSAPYGHGGKFATLLDVTKHYGTRGDNVLAGSTIGTIEEWLPNFDGNAQAALPTFLAKLTATVQP